MRFSKAILAMLVCAAIAAAQTNTGRVSGTVSDSSGAVVPGARVALLQEATGNLYQTTSNETGLYVFPVVPNGSYTVTVEMAGFKKFTSQRNLLEVGGSIVVDARLEPGSLTESVTVAESFARVQTTEAALSNVVNEKTLVSLPLNGRNPLHLMALQPGVVGHASQATSQTGTVTFYVNGDRGRGVFTTQDGIDISDPVIPRGELANIGLNPDALSEYRVVTSNAKAEYGRNSGGQVQLVTKSGTNEFHGSAYLFNRNTAYNANSFFNNSTGLPREILLRNQFGGSIGGPIRRNRAFFFFNYQKQRLSLTVPRTVTALTREARQGIFRYAAGGNSLSKVDANGNPVVPVQQYNILTNLGLPLDAVTQNSLGLIELPNSFTTCSTSVGLNTNSASCDGLNFAAFRWNAPARNPQDSIITRVDYRLGDRHNLFGRFSKGKNDLIGDFINTIAYWPKQAPGRVRLSSTHGAALGWTAVLGATKVNEFTVGYTRNILQFLDPTNPPGVQYLFTTFTRPFVHWNGTGRKPTQYQVLDNFSWVRGQHTWKTGFTARFYQINQFRNVGIFPGVGYLTTDAPVTLPNAPAGIASTDLSRLQSLYNDLLGIVGRIDQTFYSNGKTFPGPGFPFLLAQRQKEYNFYFQDDWRVTPRLSLNLGLRYEYNTVPEDRGGLQVINDRPLDGSQGPVRFVSAGPGTGRAWYRNDRNNFAPAVGLAWDPFGNQKLAVRAGYRVAYNRLVNWALNVVEQRQPGTSAIVQTRPNPTAGTVSLRASQIPNSFNLTGPAVPDPLIPPTRAESPFVFGDNVRTPYVQQWMFSVQRELARDTLLEVAYVGNKGTKLFRHLNGNQVEVVANNFLNEFLAAQRNLAATGDPRRGEAIGSFGRLLATYGSAIPSTLITNLRQGRIGDVVSTLDTSVLNGVVGGRLTASGLPQNFFRNPQFNLAGVGCTCSNSSYNALQVQVQRRMAQGLTFTANYTWSKSLDDASEDTDGAGTTLLFPRDSNNTGIERGRSLFDIHHVVRGIVIYDLPFLRRHSSRFLRHVAGGWQVNAILDLSSGFPFTVSSGWQTFTLGPNNSISNSYANFSGKDSHIGEVRREGGSITFLNAEEKALFSAPNAGEVGNQGRNMFTGPSFFQVDMGLFKSFPWWPGVESRRIEFRLEAFNAFNSVNFSVNSSDANTTQTSGSFGVISATRVPPRILQLALKFYF